MDVLVDIKMDFPGLSGWRQKVFKSHQRFIGAWRDSEAAKPSACNLATTRTYYPGEFMFSLLVNGTPLPLTQLLILG